MKRAGQAGSQTAGYAMAALLVAIAVMAVAMTVALPAWRQQTQREKEEELIFRGRQYVRAVQLFQRKYAAAYPPDVDLLVRLKFLRKKYTDPMVKDGEFEILYQGSPLAVTVPVPGRGGPQATPTPGAGGAGQSTLTFDSRSGAVAVQGGRVVAGGTVGPRGGVVGVRSTSAEPSIRTYNGATHYNEWLFMFLQRATAPGMRGGPGGGGRGPQGMGPGGDFQGGPGGMGQRGGGPGRGGQGGGPGRGGQGGAQSQPQRGGRGQRS